MTELERERESLPNETGALEPEQCDRRDFLVSLGKWSKVVIGGVALGGLMVPEQEAKAWGWGNGPRGGSWVNFRGWPFGWGYRPRWYNGPRGYGPRWYNRWYNGPGWGGGWLNR